MGSKDAQTTDICLQSDFLALRHIYDQVELSRISYSPVSDNLAHSLTKPVFSETFPAEQNDDQTQIHRTAWMVENISQK